MTRSVSLTFTGDTMVDVYAAMRAELDRVAGNLAQPAPAAPRPDPRAGYEAPPVATGALVALCAQGHPMRLIPGGTAKSGPRIGQAYPAFWKCDQDGERRETTA